MTAIGLGHIVGGARAPLRRRHRDALPLLRDGRHHHALPGLVAVPASRSASSSVHHGVLGVLDPVGRLQPPGRDRRTRVKWALIHGGFVLAASTASIVAWRLNEEQALRDPLTRLPNRALFQDRVEPCARARRSGIPARSRCCSSTSTASRTSTTASATHAGDELLCEVAERLRACVRPADTVARLGGDEFAILLEDLTHRGRGDTVARRVLDALAVPFNVADIETTIDASIGIAVQRRGADTVDELLRNADVAMYSAKDSGRGRYELFETEHARDGGAIASSSNGSSAARCDADQFVLHYQPIVSLATGGSSGSRR